MTDSGIDLLIRPVDATNREEMVEFQRVYEEAERAEFPDASVYTLEDAITLLTRPSRDAVCRGYAAFADDRMVGEGLVMGSLNDNLRRARLWAWVPPGERRRGVGAAIAAYLIDECRSLGRDILYSASVYPFERRDDHPYRRFAEKLGFTLANSQLEQRLSLPVEPRLLDELAARAARSHIEYAIRTIVGPIPPELGQGYCDVHNRLAVEAPEGDLVVEESRRTPEVLADQDAELVEQGRTRVSAVALDASGTVVALTSASVAPPAEPHVDQWATIVHSDHRGHRLGIAVKVAQIRAIQDHFSNKRFISTTNAETNAHMIAINAALGFERWALCGEFQRILDADADERTD